MYILSLLMSPLAQAADCNTYTLQTEVRSASAQEVSKAFVELAACDAAAAKRLAPQALDKALEGESAHPLVLAAIEVGAGAEARDWVQGLQSDQRSKAISSLGAACSSKEAVSAFLVESGEALGDEFWSKRWYRSLAACRTEGVQALLQAEIDSPSSDRNRFFGALEVYSQNLGAGALPTLEQLLGERTETNDRVRLIELISDAAQVGTLEGIQADTAAQGRDLIVKMAPEFSSKVLDQCRLTLQALEQQGAADGLAVHRFTDDLWDDGQLHYGLLAVEKTTCKNGSIRMGYHRGQLLEPGAFWPDQLREKVKATLEEQWTFEQASKCKGSSDISFRLSAGPLDEAGLSAWMEETYEEVQEEAKKSKDYEAPDLKL